MNKKTIPIIATSIEKISKENAFDNFAVCNCCKTITPIILNSFFCMVCNKKIEQFNSIKIFTFKPCYYIFYKIGIEKNILETIENEQKQIGYSTNYLEYIDANMVWCVYRNVSPKNLFESVIQMFDCFRQISLFNKNIFKYNIEKLKGNFYRNFKFINIGFNISEIVFDDFQMASFLPRDRIFL